MKENFVLSIPMYYLYSKEFDLIRLFCNELSMKTDITKYTKVIDYINICPIVLPEKKIKKMGKSQRIMIKREYRMADVSLYICEESFSGASPKEKLDILLENIKEALFFIELKLKKDFDYNGLISDIKEVYVSLKAFSKEMYV